MIRVFLLVGVMLSAVVFAGNDPRQGRLVVLKETGDELHPEVVALPEGKDVVVSGPDVVTFLLPLGIGQSGDLVQTAARGGTTTARFQDGKIAVRVRRPGGEERSFPPVSLEEIEGYELRVNVIAGTGTRLAYRIHGYREIVPDDGPVIDMFGGRIPLGEGDVSVTLETTRSERKETAAGRAPLLLADGLFLVEGAVPGGTPGAFIVDLGAGATAVSRSFLPEGTPIERVSGREFSPEGEREVKGTMGGAGGEVAGFLGSATLPALRIGSGEDPIRFTGAQVRVVDMDFSVAGTPVSGILGLDLLRRVPRISLVPSGDGRGTLELHPGASAPGAAGIAEIPFTVAANHLFVEGTVGGNPVSFLVDSGARGSLLSRRVAGGAALRETEGESRTFHGLDGHPIEAEARSAAEITLGGEVFRDVDVFVADLPVLRSMGLEETGALLGNDFLRRFPGVQVDFERQVLRLGPVAGR